jgi:hypothetical protein
MMSKIKQFLGKAEEELIEKYNRLVVNKMNAVMSTFPKVEDLKRDVATQEGINTIM